MPNAITLLVHAFEAHEKAHKQRPTFKVFVSTKKQAHGECTNCNTKINATG